jgi:hypothetical protein
MSNIVREPCNFEIHSKNGWIKTRGIIDQAFLCKYPGCNKKPFRSGKALSEYCCRSHAKLHLQVKQA